MFTYCRLFLELIVLRSGIVRNQHGATMVEYALIVAIISLAVIVLGTTFSDNLEAIFSEAGTAVSNNAPSE